MSKDILYNEYSLFVLEIKRRIQRVQYEALRTVNKELVSLYWDIGKIIADKQKGNTWGKSVVQKLAADLQKEYPKSSGFSAANLWRAKLFYETYVSIEKLAPLVREIAWSHNIIIMERCKKNCAHFIRFAYHSRSFLAGILNLVRQDSRQKNLGMTIVSFFIISLIIVFNLLAFIVISNIRCFVL